MSLKQPLQKKSASSVLTAKNGAQVLFTDICKEIESGGLSDGDQLRPARVLASEYGLSFDAVRRVLERLNKQGLVKSQRGRGTFVTRKPLQQGSSGGALADSVALMMDVHGHVFRNIAEEMVLQFQDEGLSSIKLESDRFQVEGISAGIDKILTQWSDQAPPRAVVVNWVDDKLYERLDLLRACGTRIVALFGEAEVRPDWYHVGSNVEMQASLAAEWLVRRGHKRVGLVTHARHIRGNDPASHRKRTVGHTRMIVSLGHELNERLGHKKALSLCYNYAKPGGWSDPLSADSIARAAAWLSAPDRPTAVVGDDFRLVGIIRAADALGLRIPEDLELLGIGNTSWAQAYGFNSISLNERVIAREIAKIVLADKPDVDAPSPVLVAPSLDIA